MAKTPSKKSAKAAKVASTAEKKKKVKRSRVETYSSYLYKVRGPRPLRRPPAPPRRASRQAPRRLASLLPAAILPCPALP